MSASAELANQIEGRTLGPAGRALLDVINAAADVQHLDEVTKLLWKGYGEGVIGEGEAEYLTNAIQRRRPLGRQAAPGHATQAGRVNGRVISRFVSRQHQRSPDRKASRDRRRMLGGSGGMPNDLRTQYTEGQRAVLCIVAFEIKRHGVCDFPIEKIAALAGVCRTSAQTALHEGHLTIIERPRRGKKNLTNLIRISSKEWLAWVTRGPSAARFIGSNYVKMVSTTKSKDLRKEGAFSEKAQFDPQRFRGSVSKGSG
jgi:hypothetical protein